MMPNDDIVPDEWVSKLVDDPSKIPHSKLYVGWLGKSESNESWRLYLSPTLDQYLEIRRKDILHQMQVEQSPLGGSFVWVDRDAKVTHTRTSAAQSQADFLSGGITASMFNRPGSRLPIAAPGEPVYATWTIAVVVTFFALALGTQVSAILDCFPQPNDSQGPACATNLSHCC